MLKTKLFSEAEVAEPDDFEDISEYAREGGEAVVGGSIAYPHHWAGMTVSMANSVELSISTGYLFADEAVYGNDAALTVNVQTYLPVTTGDYRYIALLLRGTETTTSEDRMVETDADTEETVSQSVPKTNVRGIEVTVQLGESSPTPVKPTIADTNCNLAFVELSTTGIEAIELDNSSRVKNLYEVEARLAAAETNITSAKTRVSSIETDITNIADQLDDIPNPVVVRQMQRDLAQVRRELQLPDEARAYWYDDGLVKDDWDTTNSSWLARIREGVRFPWANSNDTQLSLLDASSSDIKASDTLILPAWEESLKIEVDGDGGAKNVSELVHTVTTAVQKTLSRTVTEYGATTTRCENQSGWSFLGDLAIGETFTVDGETFIVTAINTNGNRTGHHLISYQSVTVRTVEETYWDYVTEDVGVNGSIYGQTWLCSQPMVLTSIDLSFTRVGSEGEVHLFICECDSTGQPQLDQVIASTELDIDDLAVGWVNFALTPTLLSSGTRYAWFVVTTGNHALETVSGNKFAQGTLFYCTDGAWAQGDAETDFAMRLYSASFSATRTVVQFNSLTLEDGMTDIRLLAAGWAPGGTSLTWEIKPADSDEWYQVTTDTAEDTDWLNGLPSLVQLRAVFAGTTDLQPAIVLDSKARGMCFRPRGDMKAISVEQDFGLSSDTIQLDTVLDQWDDDKHTFTPTLEIDGSIVEPASTVITEDLTNDKKRTVSATFLLDEETTAACAIVAMTSTEVTDLAFVDNIAMYAL